MRNLIDYYIKYTERIDDINDSALYAPEEMIIQMEWQYERRINEISYFINDFGEGHKLVMLAGPSSSGKTTTANMITRALNKMGSNAFRVSLDDFFLGKDKAPKLKDGSQDYESINAIDIPLMQKCLMTLLDEGKCDLPVFNFKTQLPDTEKVNHIELGENDVVIVEGIHALNPAVTSCFPDSKLIKIYISVKQGMVEGNTDVISAVDMRLIRRLVRDYQFRGSDAQRTFEMWNQVRIGERLYIDPYKRLADITINSIHIYEPCILKKYALPILSEISPESEFFDKAKSLADGLEMFIDIPLSLVPETSLLREFTGGGIYKY
ncbi:MAG: nucleoside kinase [Clostridia bacterium]|nr:nucleoside kinase [Clostridia bacterium]